jgi:drug/metabolite transporter (DMT)-like permease
MSAAPTKLPFIAAAPAAFVVLWATGFVVSKLSAGHVGPWWFLTLRFPIAGLFMSVVALQQRAPWPDAKHALHAMIAGAFLHGLYLGPIYWAVAEGLPAGVAALIVGLQPLLTAFMAALILGEVINTRHWLGLIVGLIGIVLVVWPKLIFAHVGGITPLTAFCALFGAIAISFGTVCHRSSLGDRWLLAIYGRNARRARGLAFHRRFSLRQQRSGVVGAGLVRIGPLHRRDHTFDDAYS